MKISKVGIHKRQYCSVVARLRAHLCDGYHRKIDECQTVSMCRVHCQNRYQRNEEEADISMNLNHPKCKHQRNEFEADIDMTLNHSQDGYQRNKCEADVTMIHNHSPDGYQRNKCEADVAMIHNHPPDGYQRNKCEADVAMIWDHPQGRYQRYEGQTDVAVKQEFQLKKYTDSTKTMNNVQGYSKITFVNFLTEKTNSLKLKASLHNRYHRNNDDCQAVDRSKFNHHGRYQKSDDQTNMSRFKGNPVGGYQRNEGQADVVRRQELQLYKRDGSADPTKTLNTQGYSKITFVNFLSDHMRSHSVKKMADKKEIVVPSRETVHGRKLSGISYKEQLENLSSEDKQRVEYIEKLHMGLIANGMVVPDVLTDKLKIKLLDCDNEKQIGVMLKRIKYRDTDKKRKKENVNTKIYRNNIKLTEREEVAKMGMAFFRLFRKLDPVDLNYFYNFRLVSAMIHGQPLIIDLSYDHKHKNWQKNYIAKMIANGFLYNRCSKNPFNLTLCNTIYGQDIFNYLLDIRQCADESELLITNTEASYLDLFPHDQLTYLCPNSPNVLQKFDPDAVYIIGANCQKTSVKDESHLIAKKQGIVSARLPLEKYFRKTQMKNDGEILSVNNTIRIMVDLYNNLSMGSALKRHVPTVK